MLQSLNGLGGKSRVRLLIPLVAVVQRYFFLLKLQNLFLLLWYRFQNILRGLVVIL
jgi:hypothetical protein